MGARPYEAQEVERLSWDRSATAKLDYWNNHQQVKEDLGQTNYNEQSYDTISPKGRQPHIIDNVQRLHHTMKSKPQGSIPGCYIFHHLTSCAIGYGQTGKHTGARATWAEFTHPLHPQSLTLTM